LGGFLRRGVRDEWASALSMKVVPSSLSVSLGGSAMPLTEIVERFPAAYWVEGTRILE
jgi:hypothetical protein